jgi:MFS family permease
VPARAATGDNKTDGAYLRFLVAMSFVISAMSALQIYSFFYLEDVIGLENASEGGILVLLATGAATALTVLPAGKLCDRVGRSRMLYVGAGLGVLACVILIFARSLVVVVMDGVLVGVAIGIFLTVSWTIANDLVRQRNAARDLGYASIAVFIGAAVSRVAGIGVDRLNEVHFALGYQAVLIAVAAGFIVSVVMMGRLHSGPAAARALSGGASEPQSAD